MSELCECVHWCRAQIGYPYMVRGRDGVPLVTSHHPECPHYNDSLMDVWKVTVDGVSCYVEHQQDACDCDDGSATMTKEKMHREIFEHLPEFEGF